jgi:hypothetical protein
MKLDARNRRRITLDLSERADQLLERLALDSGTTKSEVLRRAIGLFEVAQEARLKGKRVGAVNEEGTLDTEFVGIH